MTLMSTIHRILMIAQMMIFQQVRETFEETFMNEARNIGERRARRPPKRFDDKCYLANDITADINEPINIDEAFSGEHSKNGNKPLILNSSH